MRMLAMAMLALGGWCLAAAPARGELSPASYRVSALCGAPEAGHAGCMGLRLVAREAHAQQPAGAGEPSAIEEETEPPEGSLSPHELLSAYGLASVAAPANRQTVAVIDAYDDPTVEHDLQVFDEEFGLAACTSANECFTKVKVGSPAKNAGWAQEIATDVEVVHGACPSCKVLLVEASSNSYATLEAAEQEAEQRGAQEISNSWGGSEEGTGASAQSGAFDHPGTVITAAAGDAGYLSWDAQESGEIGDVDFPASSPSVVAVGGTRLSVGPGGTWNGESVWNGDGATGGGCSSVFTAPAWQQTVAGFGALGCGSARSVADVAADADPSTGVAVYDSTPVREKGVEYRGWTTIGGTSVAAPFIAATFALAEGARGVEYPAQTLYENFASDPGALHDVAVGSNGACANGFDEETGLAECTLSEEAAACSARAICVAGPGFDGPSGVGTPDGIAAFEPSGASEGDGRDTAITGSKGNQTGELANAGDEGDGPPSANGAGTSSGGSARPRAATLLAGPSLTRAARIALRRGHGRVTRLAFTFLTGGELRVKVTLARETQVDGAKRWVTLPGTLVLNAARGHDSATLKLRGGLASGLYRLTLTPGRGTGRSLVFHAG
ncbi:MAG TPA: S53 family peptidase [Solirubrobacteraceae bacterium]|nr:S53 family peptidase [Solirubrobacteraceae bacterium]